MVTFTTQDSVLTALISGEIDHHTAKEIRESIDEKIEVSMPKLLILDFSRVNFMDSSGVGLIMGRYKLMQHFGGSVKVINTSETINKVLILSGVLRLIEE